MPFQIIRNDITKVRADAIVNTANPRPRIGRGTDSAIYAAAGEDRLLAARAKIGDIAPGQAACTDAFKLNAKYIIHTVGPTWIDGEHGERDTLLACYENSLALADRLSCGSVAFPLISSGSDGFPKGEALHIALSGIQRFLLTHEMTVTLVVFDRRALELSESVIGGIEQYIDDHTARLLRDRERAKGESRRFERRKNDRPEDLELAAAPYAPIDGETDEIFPASCPSPAPTVCAPRPETAVPDLAGKSLEEVVRDVGESFQQRLFKLIDESGMDDVTVYKKANIDRKLFSHIRCTPDYTPKKKTAVAFAIALELDMPAMTDLLSRAGIAFSPSNTFDLIISFFVANGIYDVFEINAALFKYGQSTLGE